MKGGSKFKLKTGTIGVSAPAPLDKSLLCPPVFAAQPLFSAVEAASQAAQPAR